MIGTVTSHSSKLLAWYVASYKSLGTGPTAHLWQSFALNFEQQSRRCVSESQFWHEMLIVSFPKLARIFHELDERLSVSASGSDTGIHAESIAAMRSRFERAYIADFSNRMNDALDHYFSAMTTPGRLVHATSEARRFAELVAAEIEATGMEQQLGSKVVACVDAALQRIASGIPALIRADGTAFLLQQTNSSSLAHNIAAVNSLSAIVSRVTAIDAVPTAHSLTTSIRKTIYGPLRRALLDPFAVAVRHEVMVLLSRIHRFKVDRASPSVVESDDGAESSAYMLEVDARLAFFRDEVLGRLELKEWRSAWCVTILTRALQLSTDILLIFLLHASLLRISEESDRLQLTTDMTKLELCISQVLSQGSRLSESQLTLADCGAAYNALRQFRYVFSADQVHALFAARFSRAEEYWEHAQIARNGAYCCNISFDPAQQRASVHDKAWIC